MKRSRLLDLFQRHLLGGGYLCRLAFARGAPFLETANDDEKRRHKQHRKAGRGEHAAEHRDADRLARTGAGAASSAASMIGLPSNMRRSRATSTIKIAFLAESAISSTRPI